MIGLPTEEDADLQGIIDILKEATDLCRKIKRESEKGVYGSDIDFTCTISNFVPKPFTPFQWFGQNSPEEFSRKQKLLRQMLREARLNNVQLNATEPQTSLLEAVISRGDRKIGKLIHTAWTKGAVFDAWDDRLKPELWWQAAAELQIDLIKEASADREVGSDQPWDVVNVGLANWWLVNEWKKAMAVKETAPCSENTCHACGICTDLDTTHVLANPPEIVLGKNPFVKAVEKKAEPETHPSLAFEKTPAAPPNQTMTKLLFEFSKTGELKFISHLDLQHLLARAARRARMNVSYSEGFNPGPKLGLALSLSLYLEGLAEVGEIELADAIEPEEFVIRLNEQLPPEVRITRALKIDKSRPATAVHIGRAVYRAQLNGTEVEPEKLSEKITAILSQENLFVETQPKERKNNKRRSKGHNARKDQAQAQPAVSQRDIRPGIYSLAVAGGKTPATIEMELAHGPKLHVKPSDVLGFVEPSGQWRLVRVALLTEEGIPLFEHART
jgi:radical SAM-linked protein